MDGRERAIAIVPQYKRRSTCSAEHNVQITVRFNVHGPCAGVRGAEQRCRKFRLLRHVGELLRGVLTHEAQPTCARENQVRLEVVIEIDGENSFGCRG